MFIEYNGIFFKATFRNKGLVPVFVDLLNFPDFHIVSHKLVCVSEDQLNNSLFWHLYLRAFIKIIHWP